MANNTNNQGGRTATGTQEPKLDWWKIGDTIHIVAICDTHVTIYRQQNPTPATVQLLKQNNQHAACQAAQNLDQQTHSFSNIESVHWSDTSNDITAQLHEPKRYVKTPSRILTTTTPELAAMIATEIAQHVNPDEMPTKRRQPVFWPNVWAKLIPVVSLALVPTIGSVTTKKSDVGLNIVTGFAESPLLGVLTFDLALLSFAFAYLLRSSRQPGHTYQVIETGSKTKPKLDWSINATWTMFAISAISWAYIAKIGYDSFQP